MDTLLSKSFAVPSEHWIKEKSATRSSHEITNHYIGDDIALATFYVVVSFPFFSGAKFLFFPRVSRVKKKTPRNDLLQSQHARNSLIIQKKKLDMLNHSAGKKDQSLDVKKEDSSFITIL